MSQMEGFNPLDLLASAAELQQKNDDGPQRIVITRQRRSAVNAKPGSTNGQKENRELSTNNNNYVIKGRPNVVIVKKVKKYDINPELEKMLDEHNYGNAKRTINHEHSYGSVKRLKSDDTPSNSIQQCGTENSDQVKSPQVVTISGEHTDNVAAVISNTSSSQLNDSECKTLGKCTVKCTDKNDCSHTCVNRICLCSCKHETTENKCSNDIVGTCVNSCVMSGEEGFIDKAGHKRGIDQSGDNDSETFIVKCDKGIVHKDTASSEIQSYVEESLKLDEQTGEFISKQGKRVSVDSNLNKTVNSEETNSVSLNEQVEKNIGVSVVSSDGDDEHEPVPLVKNSVSCSVNEMPYVNVLPSNIISESVADNPSQTLVIRLSGGQKSIELSKNQVDFDTKELRLEYGPEMSKSDLSHTHDYTPNVTDLVKSYNSSDYKERQSVSAGHTSSKISKLEMPHCSSHRLSEKLNSCSSLKELEFTDSDCAEDSASSVHLLSPDRRNPDSMGVVESPVTQTVNELYYSGKSEVYNELTDDIQVENKTAEAEICTDSVCSSGHNDSAFDTEIPGRESISDSRELSVSNLLSNDISEKCDKSANTSTPSSSGTDVPIFRFVSDHCYAGMPRTDGINKVRISVENESSGVHSEGEEVHTPLGSTSELSQDSGYEDVTQSPEVEQAVKNIEEEPAVTSSGQNVKNLVPVLVSVNSNGSLTVHDTDLTKTLSRQVFLPDSMKLISGSNITPLSQAPPLVLSPVSVGKPSRVEVPKLVHSKSDNKLELLTPKATENKPLSAEVQDLPPVTYGTFKIGTFASFSKTGMSLETPKVSSLVKPVSEEKPKKLSPSSRSRSNSGKSSPVVDTLGTLVQKVKSNLSPASNIDWSGIDYLQHDHDYCTKNLMPSVVSSFLEARLLSKDPPRGKIPHSKAKRSDSDSVKSEGKTGKRKKIPVSLKEEYVDDLDIDSEGDSNSLPEPVKQKYRVDKFIEPKRTDPKVKITGSSNFQDQFVYFMNTKKRSRRRESKDTPPVTGSDRVFIPPKPGDIIVPHLTDQDIENLKIRSKQSKQPSSAAGFNSLRNEFMAAKISNGTFSASHAPETVDDEKNIINTILSLENEDLTSPVTNEAPSYNESVEMYGQGLGSDIMNLLPEQMNLTQEQMDLLYSAVDEVQNSSPGLIVEDKLVSTGADNPAFQFPITSFVDSNTTGSPLSTSVTLSDNKLEKLGLVESNIDGKDKSIEEGKTADDFPEKEVQNVVTSDIVAPTNGIIDTSNPVVQSQEENKKSDNECRSTTKNSMKLEGAAIESAAADKDIPVVSDSQSVTQSATAIPSRSETLSEVVSDSVKTVASCEGAMEVSAPSAGGINAVLESGNHSGEVNTMDSDKVRLDAIAPGEGTMNAVASDIISDSDGQSLRTISPVGTLNSIATGEHMVAAGAVSVAEEPEGSGNAGIDSLVASTAVNVGSINPVVPDSDVHSDKQLFSTPNFGSGLVTPSSFASGLSSVTSTPISTDISLQPIDKSLDLLGNLRFDRGDLFSEPSAPVGGLPATSTPSVPSSSQLDYNAPWIVTVSMYWNDLPAIMINNQPFVRLVDIHKQILPAKDTGILKKRCQLMGIEVENCTEMQRYFLVQYGKAINSKSTLIISKDNAKVLIGYYVEPQPKATRADEHHKSIIDHRREQLRRIALARRAAVRAQRLSEKKDEPDPREIKDTSADNVVEPTSGKSQPTSSKRVEVPVVTSGPTLSHNTTTDTSRSQRATRHKKINFLEMLRGDTTSQTNDDSNEDQKKSNSKVHADSSDAKRKGAGKDRKVKIVKYTIETDSSEETESVESDFSSADYDTDTTSESEGPVKQQKISQTNLSKAKSKIKSLTKPFSNKPPLKLKLGIKRPNLPLTPTMGHVQHFTKATGTTAHVFKSQLSKKLNKLRRMEGNIPSVARLNDSDVGTVNAPVKSTSAIDSVRDIGVDMIIRPLRPEIADTQDLKVSPTLPEDILQTGDSSDSVTSDIPVNGTSHIINENGSTEKIIDSETEAGENVTESPLDKNSLVNLEQISNNTGHRSHSSSPVQTNSAMPELVRKGITNVGMEELSVKIIHRDSSPLLENRGRSQLGEVFVNRYHNKKSVCVRCYTCRKMMSVDNFMRHLHDVSGGLVNVNCPQTIDAGDAELNEPELKLWESFQRKKELFDNNQLPSGDIDQHTIVYSVGKKSDVKIPDLDLVKQDCPKKIDGPKVINTPISPFDNEKVVRKNSFSDGLKSNSVPSQNAANRRSSFVKTETPEGTRTSSRKRKVKQLEGFEDYSFSKFPRLMKNAVVDEDSS